MLYSRALVLNRDFMKKQDLTNQDDAFEMIELATDDLEVLTRAFDVIKKVCEEKEFVTLSLDEELSDTLIN